jgi:SAM-dependent methyltransferase
VGRWFEQRKRDLVLALLPRPTFESTIEVGCSTGALAEALAERSARVLAADSSRAAVAAARHRFHDDDRVEVAELDLPRDWPDARIFDLVVISEVGYFMTPPGLDDLVARVAGSLAPTGVVVLCHWRHPIEGWVLDASDVHQRFQDSRLPPVAATYRDMDVEIVVLAANDSWPDPEQ